MAQQAVDRAPQGQSCRRATACQPQSLLHQNQGRLQPQQVAVGVTPTACSRQSPTGSFLQAVPPANPALLHHTQAPTLPTAAAEGTDCSRLVGGPGLPAACAAGATLPAGACHGYAANASPTGPFLKAITNCHPSALLHHIRPLPPLLRVLIVAAWWGPPASPLHVLRLVACLRGQAHAWARGHTTLWWHAIPARPSIASTWREPTIAVALPGWPGTCVKSMP